ncbi:MAG: N-acetylneuraminate synthase family protein [Alphaproteobacteria bacterium]|nr:N-acetylneuraminate synthase family protein [Alphaproteobacteria bacterium]
MKPEIFIGERGVGENHPVYFIADIAASHDGDLEKAKDLIYSAAEGGADAAKFQNFEARTIVSDYGFRALGSQQSHQASWKKSVYEVYEDAELPVEWTPILKETCDKAGIDYFTAPYSAELTDAVTPYVKAWKMGSGDITWHEQIEKMCSTGKPFLLATGATDMEEVRAAVAAARKHQKYLVLMQCNTNYTANLKEDRDTRYARFRCINLKVLETFAREFPFCILGLSDHTHGADTVLGAVGLYNARAIEKHYTLDNDAKGPDHPFSMNPKSWAEMILQTREVEKQIKPDMDFEARMQTIAPFIEDMEALHLSLGDGIKRVEDNERETVVLQRRAARAVRALKAGEIISPQDFFPLRPAPEGSVAPYQFEECVGQTLKRDIEEGDCLMRTDVDEQKQSRVDAA